MTCIIGIKDEKTGKIYLGCDSAVTMGNHIAYSLNHPKIFKRGEFLFGGAGALRDLQIVGHVSAIPPCLEKQDPLEYMINILVPELRKSFNEVGRMEIIDSQEEGDSIFLVVFRGHLYLIAGRFDVLEIEEGFQSIGSGYQCALGSLNTTKGRNMDAKSRIKVALETAAKYDIYVNGPFEIIDEEGNVTKWSDGEPLPEEK